MAMTTIRKEMAKDIPAREGLIERAFGDARFDKASERLREGRMPAHGLSFVATDRTRLVGTVRLWHVAAGPARRALLLGPLAVDETPKACIRPTWANLSWGARKYFPRPLRQ